MAWSRQIASGWYVRAAAVVRQRRAPATAGAEPRKPQIAPQLPRFLAHPGRPPGCHAHFSALVPAGGSGGFGLLRQFTQARRPLRVGAVAPGSVVRDSKQVGLLVRVGKRSRSFRHELAHRSGDTRRTISQALGSRPHVSCDDARTAAARLDADRKCGSVPVARRGGATLGQAAAEHFAALGDTRWRAEAERFYRMHLSHWAGRNLASLSASPEVVDWHRDVTQRRGP
jgi:hypothetical protein